MNRSKQRVFPGLPLISLPAGFSVHADSKLLWQIGRPDHANAEFALAPGN